MSRGEVVACARLEHRSFGRPPGQRVWTQPSESSAWTWVGSRLGVGPRLPHFWPRLVSNAPPRWCGLQAHATALARHLGGSERSCGGTRVGLRDLGAGRVRRVGRPRCRGACSHALGLAQCVARSGVGSCGCGVLRDEMHATLARIARAASGARDARPAPERRSVDAWAMSWRRPSGKRAVSERQARDGRGGKSKLRPSATSTHKLSKRKCAPELQSSTLGSRS